jgi:allantoinase
VIAAVTEPGDEPAGLPVDDAGDAVVLPGVVDSHVPVNEPGRTGWEGFAAATRAAAAGGVTTRVDMPLNSVPATTDAAALAAKRRAAAGGCRVDVGFWGGVGPGNRGELAGLWAAGVLGFKAFLCPSGVDEFPAIGDAELRGALEELARLGAPLLVHAEDPAVLAAAEVAWDRPGASEHSYATYLASRPAAAEVTAIRRLIELSRATGARVHVVHLAAADALANLEAARAAGVPITVETCPHYLAFAADEIADGATVFKCAPPIREPAHREALWRALGRGAIDLVASDHSPSPPELKRLDDGDLRRAWGGVAGLELALAAVWTGARERGHGPADLARWMCAGPARLAGLDLRRDLRKGTIAVGYDADLVIWEPETSVTVDPAALYQRHPLTPYAGRRLWGRVRRTFVRGRQAFADGVFAAEPGGQLLHR